jgi:restriction endonuclease S subunit
MKKKLPKSESLEQAAKNLQELRIEKKELEKDEKHWNDYLLERTKPGDVVFFKDNAGVEFEARHIESETPMINPDISWIKKKAGALFDRIIKVSVTSAKEVGGEDLVNKLKIGTSKSYSIKFFEVKKDG